MINNEEKLEACCKHNMEEVKSIFRNIYENGWNDAICQEDIVQDSVHYVDLNLTSGTRWGAYSGRYPFTNSGDIRSLG